MWLQGGLCVVVPREERINRSTDQPDWLWMTWSAVLCIVPMDMYCRLRFRTVDIDEEHGLSRIQLCAYLVQNDSSWMTGRSPRQLHKSGFAISARFQLSSRSVYLHFLCPYIHLHTVTTTKMAVSEPESRPPWLLHLRSSTAFIIATVWTSSFTVCVMTHNGLPQHN